MEKKYGQPMSYWFDVMAKLADQKYPEQVEYLRANHGFSQTHANALVMFSRGSESAQRFKTPSEFFKTLSPQQAKTVRAIFKAIKTKYPDLELVIAWNQPMLRSDGKYIFGISAAKNHILMAPWSKDVIEKFAPKIKDLDVKKKTIGVPNDWVVDEKLLQAMVKARLAETK
jgi:uncharacterized protein YdhG (YjbR/CyaY superfamily)